MLRQEKKYQEEIVEIYKQKEKHGFSETTLDRHMESKVTKNKWKKVDIHQINFHFENINFHLILGNKSMKIWSESDESWYSQNESWFDEYQLSFTCSS